MASPLTLILPIIPGTDLKVVAATLAQYSDTLNTALKTIGTVHYARTLLIDTSVRNLQPTGGPSDTLAFAIITEYDNSFDKYIKDFVTKVGPVFDALLQFVVDGAAVTPVANHVIEFGNFIKANDVSQSPGNTGLFQAYDYTVQAILAAGD
jgi:hypothetical protein